MKKKITVRRTAILAIGLILLAWATGLIQPGRALMWMGIGRHARPSLIPKLARPLAVRFDPSFYYTGLRPSDLAEKLAGEWARAGINRVYYRAYDPAHGAFYKTRYRFNEMGDYGRYDLLGQVLKECGQRGIEVWAWVPVLNHEGAWRAQPTWRSKNAKGEDASETGLENPLCARNPDVRAWWLGYLTDLLENYPKLRGIDLGEPVVSWRAGDVCSCALCAKAVAENPPTPADLVRSQPLMGLLAESIDRIHTLGKLASVTFIQPAGPSGNLLSTEEVRKLTGFDLAALLGAEPDRTPDSICPEFIWQELLERFAPAAGGPSPFSPQWTQGAVARFMAGVSQPVEVVAHIEATDFGEVHVSPDQLTLTGRGALQAGASGLDVYDAHLLDEKKAWGSVAELASFNPIKKCLVLHDEQSDQNDAIQTGELLRHFNVTVTHGSAAQVTSGTLAQYDNILYVATRSGGAIAPEILHDLASTTATVCWMGFNINRLLSQPGCAVRLGFSFIDEQEGSFSSVDYKGVRLPKEDPWTNRVEVRDAAKCRILATATGKDETVPYALRSGRRFWFFADVPTAFAVEGDRFLVFADLLHDILNEDHAAQRLAMVRIEDVHPLTDPASLRRLADLLHGEGVPFEVAMVPNYVYPEANEFVTLAERPKFCSAIRAMTRKGGAVVMHGATHQRFGETTSDYEFWDPLSDSPPEGDSERSVRDRIETGLADCWREGIYPLMWETPHYAGSQALYGAVAKIFSVAMERRQSIDRTGTDQYFPYLITRDRFGQTIVPENMGYIPLTRPEPEVVLGPARNMKVVRDGVASFFFHPFVDHAILRKIIQALKREGVVFADVSDLSLRVQTRSGVVTNREGPIELKPRTLEGEERWMRYPGFGGRKKKVYADSSGVFAGVVMPSPGELYAAVFTPSGGGQAANEETRPEDVDELMRVTNDFGEPCRVPIPLLVSPAQPDAETQAYADLFTLLGLKPSTIQADRFKEVPEPYNLLLIPSASAEGLTAGQVSAIVDAVKAGQAGLITSGFGALSDALGIDPGDARAEVQSVVDLQYPDIEIRWPKSQPFRPFDAPADAVFFFQDRDTENPVVVGSPLGDGRYMFLGVPLATGAAEEYTRYPYLLSHSLRYLGLFPKVRRSMAEVYFNPGEREDVNLEDLIKYWRRGGVRAIYAGAWQVYPEWTYDYERLIDLAHSNGMLVYAWLEPPYVNEKFWLEHPQWRERNGLDQEAAAGWRKPMALGDPECLAAACGELKRMMESFAWDGAVLRHLGWESGPGGAADPAGWTPFHPSVRQRFQREHGFDPLELATSGTLHAASGHPEDLKLFEQFRSQLARESLEPILKLLADVGHRQGKGWEIILTHDMARPGCGLTREDVAALGKSCGASLQLANAGGDPWSFQDSSADLIELNTGDRRLGEPFTPGAPTAYPTGLALYRAIAERVRAGGRFSFYTEASLYEVDLRMLPFVFATEHRESWRAGGLALNTPKGGEVFFNQRAGEQLMVDERITAAFDRNRMVAPVGEHRIAPASGLSVEQLRILAPTRIVELGAELIQNRITHRGVELEYRSPRRAILVLNDRPRRLAIDGVGQRIEPRQGPNGWSLILPAGQHVATVVTRGPIQIALIWLSLVLSNGIVLVSVAAIGGIVLVIVWRHLRTVMRGGRKS